MNNDKYLEEHVLVFPTQLLHHIGLFQGLTFELDTYLKVLLDPKNYMFMKRREAENNPEYKQLIPYALLHHKSKVFVYRRGKLLAEKRLQGNYSIGIGGHIGVTDPGLFGTTYEDGLNRELREEVTIETSYTQRIAALLNDDSNDVGKVHFGIVHILSLAEPIVKPKEKSIKETKFSSLEELQSGIEAFENWSKICIQNIDRIIDMNENNP